MAEDNVQIIYMDDDGNVVEKSRATTCRIIEYSPDGERIMETYAVINQQPNNQMEVEK